MRVFRAVSGIAAILIAAFAVVVPVAAAGGSVASLQSYATAAPLSTGTIVELTGKDSGSVKIATKSELQNMFGVIVDRNLVQLQLSSDASNVYVATSGTYDVLVSTENGPIATSDYVTLSSVDGVAMKAGTIDDQKTVFGRATAPFDGKGVTLSSATLKDSNGVTKTVKIGSIPVTVNIQRNPNDKSTKTALPDFLQRVGKAIAEKEVSPIRIYLSLAITVISLIAAIAVLYSGVRSGVISIGRNPMGKKSIFRALLEVILTSFLILIIGLFAVYLLLKL